MDVLDMEGQRALQASGAEVPGVAAPRPRWIRLLRGVVGILLLALAWFGLVGVALLVHGATDVPLKLSPPSLRMLLPIAQLVLAVWIGFIAATLVLVGSFLIWLALTVRGW
jgi:hypothetical protein